MKIQNMSILRLFICSLLVCNCFGRMAVGSEVSAEAAGEFRSIVQWLREQRVPFPAEDRCIRITVTGKSYYGQRDRTVIEEGILIATDGLKVVAYTDEMRLLSVVPKKGDVSLSIDEAKLTEVIRDRLDHPESFKKSDVDGFCWERGIEFGDHRSAQSLEPSCRKLILAYWCHELGDTVLRDRLIDSAVRENSGVTANTMRRDFTDRVGSCFLGRAVVSIADPENSHDDVGRKIEHVVSTFYDQDRVPSDILDLVSRFKSAGNDQTSFGKALIDNQQLTKLLYQQRCRDCLIDHGETYDYMPVSTGHISPAILLLERGYEAAPSLISMIGDRMPTRRVLDSGNLRSGPYVDSVGEMSVDLLVRIVGPPSLPYLRSPETEAEIAMTRSAFEHQVQQAGTTNRRVGRE